jgi:L-amino acid N-acyltransferase YncA
MELKSLQEENEKRRLIRALLSPTSPADALASYYALWHDPRRTQIRLHNSTTGVDGFLAISQTGADLFRPLVTLRAQDSAVAGELVRTSLAPNRPYQVIAPIPLASAVREILEITHASTNRIYQLEPSRFQPVINVLVQQGSGADGSPRFQIESQGQVVAMAGTNWRSPTFAEVFVYVHPTARGRGWGRSVVSACTAELLAAHLRPLYMVEEGNMASLEVAEGLGYEDTGAREFTGEGRLAT